MSEDKWARIEQLEPELKQEFHSLISSVVHELTLNRQIKVVNRSILKKDESRLAWDEALAKVVTIYFNRRSDDPAEYPLKPGVYKSPFFFDVAQLMANLATPGVVFQTHATVLAVHVGIRLLRQQGLFTNLYPQQWLAEVQSFHIDMLDGKYTIEKTTEEYAKKIRNNWDWGSQKDVHAYDDLDAFRCKHPYDENKM